VSPLPMTNPSIRDWVARCVLWAVSLSSTDSQPMVFFFARANRPLVILVTFQVTLSGCEVHCKGVDARLQVGSAQIGDSRYTSTVSGGMRFHKGHAIP
jgi:hypothetical protein